jgi:hypothetical protein
MHKELATWQTEPQLNFSEDSLLGKTFKVEISINQVPKPLALRSVHLRFR